MYEWIFDRCEDEVCRFSCIQYTLHLRHSSGGLHTGNDFYISQSTRARVWCVLEEMNRLDASKCVFFSLLLFGGEDAQIEFDCFAFQRESESCLSSTQCTLQKGEKPREGRLAPCGLTFQSVKTPMRNKGEKVKDCPTRIIFYSWPCILPGCVSWEKHLNFFSFFFLFLQNKRSYKGTAQLSSTFKPKTFPAGWNLFSISIYFFPK